MYVCSIICNYCTLLFLSVKSIRVYVILGKSHFTVLLISAQQPQTNTILAIGRMEDNVTNHRIASHTAIPPPNGIQE